MTQRNEWCYDWNEWCSDGTNDLWRNVMNDVMNDQWCNDTMNDTNNGRMMKQWMKDRMNEWYYMMQSMMLWWNDDMIWRNVTMNDEWCNDAMKWMNEIMNEQRTEQMNEQHVVHDFRGLFLSNQISAQSFFLICQRWYSLH